MSYRISAERVAHETVDGEVVILDRLNGSYFSLTGAGADAWALFAEPRTPELVADALARHYDADAATVRAAILRTRAARIAPAAQTAPTRMQAEKDVAELTINGLASGDTVWVPRNRSTIWPPSMTHGCSASSPAS